MILTGKSGLHLKKIKSKNYGRRITRNMLRLNRRCSKFSARGKRGCCHCGLQIWILSVQNRSVWPWKIVFLIRFTGTVLLIIDSHYKMDFDDLEIKAKDPRVKLAILCSPHNPVGRVWSRDELETFGKICIKNNILIISDEIHCDLIMPGHKHTCFPTLSEEFAQNSVTGIAASKTFNLAGLQQSSIIIPNPDIRARLFTHLENLGFINGVGGTLFGAIAATAAYNEAEEWLDDLLIYLYDNFNFLKTKLEQGLSGVKVFDLEGTYLAWADFRELGHDNETQIRLLEETAKVGLDHGNWFGDNGTGFERFNIACPRTILEKAVKSIIKALK